MREFFWKLFDTSDFPARWNCGNWDAGHGWLHIISDLLIFGAYFAIPTALAIYYLKKRSEVTFPRLLWLFVAFIFCCGASHLVEAIIFYQPVYRFSGVLKFLTAIVSWATVFAIISIAPRAFTLPGIFKVNRLLEEQVLLQKKTQATLEKSNRDLENFTLVVSHDLKNPISSALFMAELAKESLERNDPAYLQTQLDHVLESLKRMEGLVTDLHERAVVKAHVESPQPVDLQDVMEAAMLDLLKRINESGARITIGKLPVISGTKPLLIQLFTNLIHNSIKYSPGGAPIIRIDAIDSKDSVVVTVSDRGRGVSEDQLGKIFDPFERVDHDPEISGSGVGLSVCRAIMEAHGGGIGASIHPEGGMIFKLHFPAPGAIES